MFGINLCGLIPFLIRSKNLALRRIFICGICLYSKLGGFLVFIRPFVYVIALCSRIQYLQRVLLFKRVLLIFIYGISNLSTLWYHHKGIIFSALAVLKIAFLVLSNLSTLKLLPRCCTFHYNAIALL